MIDKKTLITVVLTFVVAGLLGFYGGRYYERQTFRKRMVQVRGQRFDGQPGQGFRRDLRRPTAQEQPQTSPTVTPTPK